MYYRDSQDFENLKREYKASRVENEITRTKKHWIEVTENFRQYIEAAEVQLEVIKQTTIKSRVYFERRTDYRTNRVIYEVRLVKYPYIESGPRYQWTEEGTFRSFGGREKKAAREYAESLAKEYRCEVRG